MRGSGDPVRDIAQAVLYEGYMLWPYRPDALKNQRRWTFGGILPRAWHEAGHPDDRCLMRAEVPVCATSADATVQVTFRWLHVVERRVARARGDDLEFVDALELLGERYVSWEEASEREVALPPVPLRDGANAHRRIAIRQGSATEWLEHRGNRRGGLVRSWRRLSGTVEVTVREVRDGVFRLRTEVRNETAWSGEGREDALRSSFNSSHIVMRARAADFVSLTDPPEALTDVAEACDNLGCWPVLVGETGSRDVMLASPIILSDHPSVAPESPGDLFDGGEIDELLVLNILGLTDEERAAMRSADARTREILERTESLGGAQMRRLHGTFRDIR